ncbi:MAG TPA: methyltransferase domain-containing protein [Ktedonobacteraceae bacterium]
MALNNVIYMNECGLPLNSIEWLETHHRSKAPERTQMIRDLHLERGSRVVDAGCGPGLWTPMLARAIGPRGRITGVDISTEALVTAQRRSQGKWYAPQLQLRRGTLEQLPVQPGTAHMIFSANVSQYLPNPISTFAAMGRYLAPGGRLTIKDIDFGTMHFSNIDADLQTRVLRAREQWEQIRVEQDYPFEDSWVGSKLAGYLRAAGYVEVEEKSYRIVRRFPLSQDFRFYLQGIAEWFVCEGAPLLDEEDRKSWLECFFDDEQCVLDQEAFGSEETEYVATGVWRQTHNTSLRYFDMHLQSLKAIAV